MTDKKNPKVAVVMGSDSDWPVMQKSFDIPFEARISSAHRTPEDTAEFARTAGDRGIEVIIAAAGMAAHLAGTIAAHSILPVIGVPMASGYLQGIDALLSKVQMPPGVPVATVSIGAPGAKNAAILAAQILALNDKSLTQKLTQFKTDQAQAVKSKNQKLQTEIS